MVYKYLWFLAFCTGVGMLRVFCSVAQTCKSLCVVLPVLQDGLRHRHCLRLIDSSRSRSGSVLHVWRLQPCRSVHLCSRCVSNFLFRCVTFCSFGLSQSLWAQYADVRLKVCLFCPAPDCFVDFSSFVSCRFSASSRFLPYVDFVCAV